MGAGGLDLDPEQGLDLLAGRILGPYELHERLGAGGMGVVYLATHRRLGQPRAVKVLPLQLAADPTFIMRFEREARLAAQLRHPHIVVVHDVGDHEGIHYIAMELLEGRSLRQVTLEDEPLAIDRCLRLLDQLAQAIDFAHQHQIAHRDVKPANVFVSPSDHLTLVDFGIARAAEESRLTGAGGFVGTAEYMAPEIVLGGGGGSGADLYAVGVVAYELLTGRVPFTGANSQAIMYAHVHRAPPLPRSLRPELPEPVEAVLLRQLAKTPEERFTTASAFVAALRAAAGTAPLATAPDSETGGVGPGHGATTVPVSPSLLQVPAPPPGLVPVPAPMPGSERGPRVSRRRLIKVAGGLGAATVLAGGAAGAWWLTRPRWKLVSTLRGHTELVRAVTFSPDGQLAASSSGDNSVRVWRVATGALLQTIATETFSGAAAFSPDGRLVAYGTYSDDARAGAPAWIASVQDGTKRPLTGAQRAIGTTAFSPDGKLVAGGGLDLTRAGPGFVGMVTIWQVADGAPVRAFTDLRHDASSVVFAPNNRLLAAGCSSGPGASRGSVAPDPVRVWDLTTGDQILELGGHDDDITSLAFSADSSMLATGSWEGENVARVFRVPGGAPIASYGNDLLSAQSVSFTPDGQSLVIGSRYGTLRRWTFSGGVVEEAAPDFYDQVESVGYSSDGRMMASVSPDTRNSEVRVWRAP